ncbi:proteasome assembly chaperone family protein [Haloprofundus salinisoli]|uniref:proteasome assembly chaperone family protein n=1 Tax=Haloprofundus salinisoli TaxID=2876193 RepID=UPI001CCAA755|nr:PAC2 family protein [Haloprofundus salinisoli]
MARINVLADDLEFDEPLLVEGLPGVGLVGKIAADHLVETFEMNHYANVYCESIPKVAVYRDDDRSIHPPVRIYGDTERDLLVLQSDVPISPGAATEFADCLSDWFDEKRLTPVYISGLPREKDEEPPELYGIGTGDAASMLDEAGIDSPAEMGLVSGPTGALLSYAIENDQNAVGLVVESDPQFPDPEAARVVVTEGIDALLDIEVPTDDLVDRAEEIREAKQQLAQRLQNAENDESSQAQPLRMYQ